MEIKIQARSKPFVAGLLLFVFASMAITVLAQSSGQKASGVQYRLSEVRGPIRPVDQSPLGKETITEISGGPANGSDNAFLLYTRMPAGAQGPAMFTLPVDHLYLVISGQLSVQIGTDKFVAGPDTAVVIPPDVPHHVWNAGTEPESNIEVIAPATSRDLKSMMKSAQPRKIDNAASYVRPAPALGPLKPGLNPQPFAARANGFNEQMRIDNVPPGTGGPGTHIHVFEQVYFVREGTMTFQGGLTTTKVQPNSWVIITPGLVHTNKNDGPGIERHAVFLIPEPMPGTGPADTPVEIKTRPAGQ